MKYIGRFTLVIGVAMMLVFSCKKETMQETIIEENESMGWIGAPYEKLSDYNLFVGPLKEQQIIARGIPYKPSSELFTNYAKKKRWVVMPPNGKALVNQNNLPLIFPEGTVLVKTFYYNNAQPLGEQRILETRLMIKMSSGWKFAEYVWNDEQTEAFLSMDGSEQVVNWIDDFGTSKSVEYRFPSASECLMCHKSAGDPIPIGLKPQNLNSDLSYDGGVFNQLDYWNLNEFIDEISVGEANSTINYMDTSYSTERRLRSYLDINCAHCHMNGGHCDYRPIKLDYSATNDRANLGLCVDPDEFINTTLTSIISPSNTIRSVMYYRLNSNDPSIQMPITGRSMIHQEGVDLLEKWINEKVDCN